MSIRKISHGTCHFASFHAAMMYYVSCGYEVRDICRMQLEGTFKVGEPEVKPNERLYTEHGRYHIETIS